MPNIPTIAELRASAKTDGVLLRRTITRTLKPEGNWDHGPDVKAGKCVKCGKDISSGMDWLSEWYKPCPVPDEAQGSWAELAYELVEKVCDRFDTGDRAKELDGGLDLLWPPPKVETDSDLLAAHRTCLSRKHFWQLASPLDHIFCCLLALGAARMEDR